MSTPAHSAQLLTEALTGLLSASDMLALLPKLQAKLEALEVQVKAASLTSSVEEGLHPDHFYNARQAGLFLGVTKATVNNIDRTLLPRPSGKAQGVDIMAYRGDITHDDAVAYKEAKRQSVLRLIKSPRSHAI